MRRAFRLLLVASLLVGMGFVASSPRVFMPCLYTHPMTAHPIAETELSHLVTFIDAPSPPGPSRVAYHKRWQWLPIESFREGSGRPFRAGTLYKNCSCTLDLER